MTWKQQYATAHKAWQERTYPTTFADFGHLSTIYPDTRKANGLTRMIVNFLTWSGHYANRISSAGRIAPGLERQASGITLTVKKFIPSTTKKGTADIHAIINGRHVSIEIKIGHDRMSEHQIKEQERIERAGGVYIIIKTPEQFFEWYQKFILS